MIKIATPISHQFENNKFAKQIIKYSDCLELRERSLHTNWKHQKLFHVDIDITHEWDNNRKKYLKNIFKKKKELELITFQSTRCCLGEKIKNNFFQLNGKEYSRSELLFWGKKNIQWLKDNLDKNVLIGVENNNFYPTKAYKHVTDGDFLTQLILENNVFLLLDIAHALVTSHNKKMLFENYLSLLPLDKIIQLHICQPKIKKGQIAFDAHNYPNTKTFKIVEKLLTNYKNIKFVTVEYYKNTQKLIKSLSLLKKIIKKI